MSDILRALLLTRTNIEMLRSGKLPSPSSPKSAPLPSSRGKARAKVRVKSESERRPTVEPFEWKNPGLYYWRTPRVDGRFEAMVTKGRDGGSYANVYSYVVFDYSNTSCSVVRMAKGKTLEDAKEKAENVVRAMRAAIGRKR